MTELAICLVLASIAATATRWVCHRFPHVSGFVPWLTGILAILFVSVAFLDRPFGSGTDEVVYHDQSQTVRLSLILTGGYDDDCVKVDSGRTGWPSVLGTIYYLIGEPNPYLGILVNVTVVYLPMLLAAAAGQRLWGDRQWRSGSARCSCSPRRSSSSGPPCCVRRRPGWPSRSRCTGCSA